MVVRKLKDKCKDAARMRRDKEKAEFVELSKLLPLPSSTTSQLDKASVIRLTSSYLRMRSAFPNGLGENWGSGGVPGAHEPPTTGCIATARKPRRLAKTSSLRAGTVRELGSLILQTLDGFVLALHRDGKIMYISETASVHLGLPQIDLTGSSIFEFVHPADHNDICEALSIAEDDDLTPEAAKQTQTQDPPTRHKSSQASPEASLGDHVEALQVRELARAFCLRMKCILPKRNAGLVTQGYKAIHCTGYLKLRRRRRQGQPRLQATPSSGHDDGGNDDWEPYALVAVGHSLMPSASTELQLNGHSFMFRASLDLKLYYLEQPLIDMLGYQDSTQLVGRSLYELVHVDDMQALQKCHNNLLQKGQVVTKYYRLMKRQAFESRVQDLNHNHEKSADHQDNRDQIYCSQEPVIWIQSFASLVNNPRNMPKPQHIVSICFVLANYRNFAQQEACVHDRITVVDQNNKAPPKRPKRASNNNNNKRNCPNPNPNPQPNPATPKLPDSHPEVVATTFGANSIGSSRRASDSDSCSNSIGFALESNCSISLQTVALASCTNEPVVHSNDPSYTQQYPQDHPQPQPQHQFHLHHQRHQHFHAAASDAHNQHRGPESALLSSRPSIDSSSSTSVKTGPSPNCVVLTTFNAPPVSLDEPQLQLQHQLHHQKTWLSTESQCPSQAVYFEAYNSPIPHLDNQTMLPTIINHQGELHESHNTQTYGYHPAQEYHQLQPLDAASCNLEYQPHLMSAVCDHNYYSNYSNDYNKQPHAQVYLDTNELVSAETYYYYNNPQQQTPCLNANNGHVMSSF